MKLSRHILLLFVSFICTTVLLAQPGYKVDVEKPKPYQERKLKAEKTGEGKIKPVKRIWQNLTTRYNYVFNANNKMSEVLERAREQHKDDFSTLLSFYDYDLSATAADSAQLDTIIYKARTGILNHDLRIEWGDELYLLWAQAWHLQKKLDSASLMLQFINYAYAPQYEDGYYKYIGTNTDGARELSIATKEEKHFLHSNTFGRNNAFVWQIRTRTEMDDFTTAGSLITTLRRDPIFPARLGNALDEAEAYWHYRQQHWDSAAAHLLAALDGDYSKLEKARWRYLAAQMLERAGKPDEAVKLYEKVISSTPDPVMDVYARLNLVRLSPGGEGVVDKNIAELLKMAKRGKYEEYRDIIYYMAARMELERNNIAAATELLIKGSKFDNGNADSRNKAFLQTADVLYDQKKYLPSASFYDSVQVETLAEKEAARVGERKPPLRRVVLNTGVVYRQDSLQKVAAMPQEERDALIKKTLKRLRKQKGLKEEAAAPSTGSGFAPLGNDPPADLFATQQKGEWYFYNSNAKAQGAAQFKSVWGDRPSVDNWRRAAAASQRMLASPDDETENKPTDAETEAPGETGPLDLTFEGLLGQLPTTPEGLKASDDSIRNALFQLGTTYLNEMEDYPSAIETFEELRRRFPDAPQLEEALFNLQYAYTKAGNTASAAAAKKLLGEKFSGSRYATIAATGKDPQAVTQTSSPEATKAYEHVYNLFIEGAFADAEKAKRIADSTYQTNFWQPQLLYIEAVYYIKQRQDSTAKEVLETIISQNTNKALSAKAQNLIDVLARRQEIEDELTKLQITRPAEDTVTAQPVAYQKPADIKDTTTAKPKPGVDSAALAKEREKQLKDSLALANATAKQLRDSLEKAKNDSIALAKKQAAQARADSLAKAALAARQRQDSIALAKETAAKAKKDALAVKALADKNRKDSIAQVKAVRDQAQKDSLALAAAIKAQARDSLALSKYLAKHKADSLERIRTDSIAAEKKKTAQAKSDSLARAELAAKQRRDSLGLVKEQRDKARRDSLATKALAARQRQDSIALAKEEAAKLRSDSLAAKALADRQKRDSIAAARAAREQARRDSIALAKSAPKPPDVSPLGYTFNPGQAHYAVVVLDKVDPIFVGEAKNAFTRYNKEAHYGEPLDVQIVNVTADTRLLLISGLSTAAAATDYVEKAKPLAATEIVPWLKGNKYNFSIISAPNLEILKARTKMEEYQTFLEQHLPGKF